MAARDKAARVASYITAEEADEPSLCNACLGPSTHVRMMRMPKGKKCHVCDRQYTSFQWRAANDARPRFTLICKGCSADKNACQSCMHDLATGLSMELRSQLSGEELANLLERKRNRTTEEEIAVLAANEEQLARRFQQKVCTFFAKGHCARGGACPYRHVQPARSEAAVVAPQAAIRARFEAGTTQADEQAARSEPAAAALRAEQKLLALAASAPPPPPPPPIAVRPETTPIESGAAGGHFPPSNETDKAPVAENGAPKPTDGKGVGFDFGFLDDSDDEGNR